MRRREEAENSDIRRNRNPRDTLGRTDESMRKHPSKRLESQIPRLATYGLGQEGTKSSRRTEPFTFSDYFSDMF